MYTELLIILGIALILLGLTKSTESVLAIRQHQREKGKEPMVYL